MRVAQFMIFMLLTVSHLMAENEPRDQAKAAESTPNAASLPSTPRPQKVIDKKFIAIIGTLALGESMRFTTRTLVVEHEADAGAPWITSRPSHSHLIAKDAGIFIAEAFVAYEIKKPHAWLPGDKIIRQLWWLYPAAMAVPHFKSAVHNIRLQPPVACPIANCRLQ